jgi:hypothetical protein
MFLVSSIVVLSIVFFGRISKYLKEVATCDYE